MYNEELKEKFIADFNTTTGRRTAARTLFKGLEKYEEEWGADFCTRSREEITPVVGQLVGFREGSQKTRLSILKAYVKWCIQNNVEGAHDELSGIEDFGLDKLKHQMVSSPQHLQRFLNSILEPEVEDTIDNVFRCYYWLAFSGVKEEDALKITSDNVDLTSMVVEYEGQLFPIYREAVPALKRCVEQESFRFKHPNYEMQKPRLAGNQLLRGLYNKKTDGKTSDTIGLRVEMSKKQRKRKFRDKYDEDTSLDLNLSYYRVGLSGLFYRTYEAERMGMPPDFMDAAERFMQGKTYKLDSGRNKIGARQRRIAGEYRADYNRWKEAYSI